MSRLETVQLQLKYLMEGIYNTKCRVTSKYRVSSSKQKIKERRLMLTFQAVACYRNKSLLGENESFLDIKIILKIYMVFIWFFMAPGTSCHKIPIRPA